MNFDKEPPRELEAANRDDAVREATNDLTSAIQPTLADQHLLLITALQSVDADIEERGEVTLETATFVRNLLDAISLPQPPEARMTSILSIYRHYLRGGNGRVAAALRTLHVYRRGF